MKIYYFYTKENDEIGLGTPHASCGRILEQAFRNFLRSGEAKGRKVQRYYKLEIQDDYEKRVQSRFLKPRVYDMSKKPCYQ